MGFEPATLRTEGTEPHHSAIMPHKISLEISWFAKAATRITEYESIIVSSSQTPGSQKELKSIRAEV